MASEEKYFCGPFFMPKFIKKALSDRFNHECEMHDFDYNEKLKTRRQADRDFRYSMLLKAKTKKDKCLAYSYYYAVRAFGWYSWRKSK